MDITFDTFMTNFHKQFKNPLLKEFLYNATYFIDSEAFKDEIEPEKHAINPTSVD